jgi:hypothetical protein
MGGRGNDIAFSLKPLKRGTNWSPAYPKAIGYLGFHDPRSGCQLPPDNQVPERVVEFVRALGSAGGASSPLRQGTRIGSGSSWHDAANITRPRAITPDLLHALPVQVNMLGQSHLFYSKNRDGFPLPA